MEDHTSSIVAPKLRKVKGRVDVNIERCKGCELCTATCKESALILSSTINSKGYRYIVADNERCTGCVNCALVCPDAVITVYRTTIKKKAIGKTDGNKSEQVDTSTSLLNEYTL